jgi:LysM repeat protein
LREPGRLLTSLYRRMPGSGILGSAHPLRSRSARRLVPGPYTPPQPRRTQVVRSRRGVPITPWRWWWVVPAIGLVPVLIAVLATQGAFTTQPRQAGPPVAAGVAQSTAVTSAATPTSVPATNVQGQTTGVSGSAATAAPTSVASTSVASTSVASTSGASTSGAPASPTAAPTATAVPTATTAATVSGGQPFVAYKVQPGDTVRFIAQTYGVSTASVAQASGLANPDLIRVGQVLTIPAKPGWLYRVQPGETLDQIAARTGVGSTQIASASGLTAASVGPGDVLLIPDQSVVAQSK